MSPKTRLTVSVLVVWVIIAVGIGASWAIYSWNLDPGRFTAGLLLALFAGMLSAFILALRVYSQARDFLLLRICAGLAALMAGIICAAYLLFVIEVFLELGPALDKRNSL